MKKISTWLFALVCAFFAASVFAASSHDCDIAEDLADEGIIREFRDCDDYHLQSRVTREEVAAMALEVAYECDNISRRSTYRCEHIFSDVRSGYSCEIIETLARNDIVTTSKRDRHGDRVFRPYRNITKAESLAMFMDAADIRFRNGSYDRSPYTYGGGTVAWQKPLIEEAYDLDVISSRSRFHPNATARRADIFEMALEVIDVCDGGDFSGRSGRSGDIEVEIHDISIDEDDDEVRVPVVLDGRADGDIEIEWRTQEDTAEEGEDYEEDDGTLIIREGDTRDYIEIEIEDDNRNEDTEKFIVEIVDVDNRNGRDDIEIQDDEAFVHIRDDDGRGTSDDIEIEADDETVDEDDHEVRVEVCLSERAEGDIEIEWETRDGTADEGDDYEDDHGTLRIDEGDRCETLTIDIIDDNRDETSERFYVHLTDADSDDRDDDLDIVDDEITITIRDNDSGSNRYYPYGNDDDIDVRIEDETADEDDDEIEFTVRLSHEADENIRIRFRTREDTAEEDEDYEEEEGYITIRRGDTRGTITIDLIDDHRDEPTERFEVEIVDIDYDGDDDVRIRDDRAVGTIRDDD